MIDVLSLDVVVDIPDVVHRITQCLAVALTELLVSGLYQRCQLWGTLPNRCQLAVVQQAVVCEVKHPFVGIVDAVEKLGIGEMGTTLLVADGGILLQTVAHRGVKQGVEAQEVPFHRLFVEVVAHAAVHSPLKVLFVQRHRVAAQQLQKIEFGAQVVEGLHFIAHVGLFDSPLQFCLTVNHVFLEAELVLVFRIASPLADHVVVQAVESEVGRQTVHPVVPL